MASEVAGTGGAGSGVPIPPSAAVRPAVPSRAVVPVQRTGTGLSPTTTPLGRSGVPLDALFAIGDAVETREMVPPVAMEMGLESARRQLLQHQPEGALAVLDTIWAGAADSEEGWYLRSGALTVLGHPLEGERVAGQGLEAQPDSRALRLLQSVARAMVGDLSGARAALHGALERTPADPVLLAQQALLLARQGHADDAAALLSVLAANVPEHPALAWARTAVRTAGRDRDRSVARAVTSATTHAEPVAAERAEATLHPEVAGNGAPDGALDGAPDGDMVTSAFARLGARLRHEDAPALQHHLRTLLRACSAGGTLASACTPSEAHASRQLLLALTDAVDEPRHHGVPMPIDSGARPSTPDSPAPLHTLVRQLVPVLRRGRSMADASAASSPAAPSPAAPSPAAPSPAAPSPAAPSRAALSRAASPPPEVTAAVTAAERLLRRHGATVPPAARALLAVLVAGAAGDPGPMAPVTTVMDDRAGGTPATGAAAIRARRAAGVDGVATHEVEQGPLVPVRLGLSLLAETAATRALERAQEPLESAVPLPGQGLGAFVPHGSVRTTPTDWDVSAGADRSSAFIGTGWGEARARAAVEHSPHDAARGAALPAIILGAGALGAAMNGAATVAAVLGAVAMWLLVRTPSAPTTRD
jgi:hypothetical protein